MKRAQPGYTLIELMIVVILIGIVTALAAPEISQAWANNTVSEASNETVIAFRAAITQAKRQGRAMGVFIDKDGANQVVRVDRSATNLCSDLPVCNTTGPDYGGADCGVYALNLEDGHFVHRGVEISTLGVDDGTGENARGAIRVCVPPRGPIMEMAGTTPTTIDGNVVVRVHRTTASGTSIGVARTIIIGQNGSPRTLL